MGVFREIFQICPRLPNQDFDELPSDDEIVSFIKELGHKGDINLSLKWSLIKCTNHGELLFQSSTNAYHGKSRVLTSSDFQELKFYGEYSIRRMLTLLNYFGKTSHSNREQRLQEARKDDDSILGPMRFVSRSDDFQVYGAVLPKRMTNRQMRDSNAYKSYLAYATGAALPNMKRKLKKPASPSKKRTLVTIEEEEPKPAKKVKKAPTRAERSKGIELLSDAALLEEAQFKKALIRSK
ncbi:hypothetical protein Tco_0950109 [Tanacetum coccineum]